MIDDRVEYAIVGLLSIHTKKAKVEMSKRCSFKRQYKNEVWGNLVNQEHLF